MNTLQLAAHKRHLLREIEELDELNMPGPEDGYPISKTKVKNVGSDKFRVSYYHFYYENDNNVNMKISIKCERSHYSTNDDPQAEKIKDLEIKFGVNIDNEKNYIDAVDKLKDLPGNNKKRKGLFKKGTSEPTSKDDLQFKSSTGANDFLKVLATVVNATKKVIELQGGEENIKKLIFFPSDKRRANIYDTYITRLFPNFVKISGNQGMQIYRNKNNTFSFSNNNG